MKKLCFPLVVMLILFFSVSAHANCTRFNASTMLSHGHTPVDWRTDYPKTYGDIDAPWLTIDFTEHPAAYMQAVLDTVRPDFEYATDEKRLVGKDNADWWISLWLDYSYSGREPLMGLTKERGPDVGDLSPNSTDGHQVWAVGFYNPPGANILERVFSDPCEPDFSRPVLFPEGTASVKFLFTDAPPEEVTYLKSAPEYEAFIDRLGAGSSPTPATNRMRRVVRLLQVDIATKDVRAVTTNWTFGTFVWMGPRKGDGLFDNLVPVSLQWGNDPGVYDQRVRESWINSKLQGILYGWTRRPSLGFNGRANGPADNIRSSCLSCHAAARIARSNRGIVGSSFDMISDISNPTRVKAHVDTWFDNLPPGTFFDPNSPKSKVAALDYSLQLEAAVWRMCLACKEGSMVGITPNICLRAKFVEKADCGSSTGVAKPGSVWSNMSRYEFSMEHRDPPRQ